MIRYDFSFITGHIQIDYDRCQDCENYACVKACSLFGRSILRVEDGRPVLISDDANKHCIEDLACEFSCHEYGNKGLRLILDDFHIDK